MADEATEDGFDVQMQTNHLSHFLLTRELFPLLQLGGDHYGESRVVNHSSIARLAVRRLEAKYLERRGGAARGGWLEHGIYGRPMGPLCSDEAR